MSGKRRGGQDRIILSDSASGTCGVTEMATIASEQPPPIDGTFKWDDETIYHWTMSAGKTEVAGFVGGLIGIAVGLPAAACAVLWLISLFSPAAAWWVGVSATVLFLLVLVMHLCLMWWGDREKRIEARTIVF